jgi:hypothetical protein
MPPLAHLVDPHQEQEPSNHTTLEPQPINPLPQQPLANRPSAKLGNPKRKNTAGKASNTTPIFCWRCEGEKSGI